MSGGDQFKRPSTRESAGLECRGPLGAQNDNQSTPRNFRGPIGVQDSAQWCEAPISMLLPIAIIDIRSLFEFLRAVATAQETAKTTRIKFKRDTESFIVSLIYQAITTGGSPGTYSVEQKLEADMKREIDARVIRHSKDLLNALKNGPEKFAQYLHKLESTRQVALKVVRRKIEKVNERNDSNLSTAVTLVKTLATTKLLADVTLAFSPFKLNVGYSVAATAIDEIVRGKSVHAVGFGVSATAVQSKAGDIAAKRAANFSKTALANEKEIRAFAKKIGHSANSFGPQKGAKAMVSRNTQSLIRRQRASKRSLDAALGKLKVAKGLQWTFIGIELAVAGLNFYKTLDEVGHWDSSMSKRR